MEEFLEQLLGPADGENVTWHFQQSPVSLVFEPDDGGELLHSADVAERMGRLRRLLPGLPERTAELLVAVSDALSSSLKDDTDLPPGGAGPVAGRPAGKDSNDATGKDSARDFGMGSAEGFGKGSAEGCGKDPGEDTERHLDGILVDGADATVQLSRVLEAAQVDLLAMMATRTGERLLRTEHGEVDPGALSKTKRERWRARSKSVVANELQALSGYGIQDCHDRVGFALAPPVATAPARQALVEGSSDWWQVWQWWKRCRQLDPGSAGDVATSVFVPSGDLLGPECHGSRMSRREFMNLLDREATRVEGSDTVAARQRRRQAVEGRRADATVDADGTGCLKVIGRTSAVVAAIDRVDSIARRARAAGDTRSLDQLRSDTTLALLTAGVLPAREVSPAGGPAAGASTSGPSTAADSDLDDLDIAEGGGWEPADIDRLTSVLAGHPPAVVEVVVPYDVLTGADPEGVGLLTGHGCLTGEHVREIALAPGSTFYRLVTDAASGVLVDRSVQAYEPDDEMRAIIDAADRYCRGPGCTIPAARAQADHVREHPDGPTAVSNLANEHSRHHGMKTNKWWTCVMDPSSRNVTWTSFFGRRYSTAPFDYTQLTARNERGGAPAPSDRRSVIADLQDQLVYAALAERLAGATLGGVEDEADPGGDASYYRSRERDSEPVVRLTHTPPGGEVRPGAPGGQATPQALLSEWVSPGDEDATVTGAARAHDPAPPEWASELAPPEGASEPEPAEGASEPPPF